MSILNNVEFSSFRLQLAKKIQDSKKIKFKQESYTNIHKKYEDFCSKDSSSESSSVPIETMPFSSPESIVIHITNKMYEKKESQQPNLKDRIYMLKVKGNLLPQFVSRRALKIKDTMKTNMEINNYNSIMYTDISENSKDTDIKTSIEVNEPALETIEVENNLPDERFKVSTNESTSAKIEKYSSDQKNEEAQKPESMFSISSSMSEKFKFVDNKENEDSTEEKEPVSPIVIEKHLEKPVEKENLVSIENNNKNSNPDDLKDYLTRATKLKEELSNARKQVEEAKAKAQKAKEKAAAEKKEAEAVQEKLAETIKKLEEQKRESEEEVEKYFAESQEYAEKEKEYSSMQEEYQNTINELLAVIG